MRTAAARGEELAGDGEFGDPEAKTSRDHTGEGEGDEGRRLGRIPREVDERGRPATRGGGRSDRSSTASGENALWKETGGTN